MRLNKKNRSLIIGFLFAMCICYYFAISSTFSYYKENQSQQILLLEKEISPRLLQQLIQKEKQLDSVLSQQSFKTSISKQNDLLKFLSTQSSLCNVKIVEFNEPHIFKSNNSTQMNYVFTLQGSYNGIVLLLNQIENQSGIGYIGHVDYVKKRNYKSNLDELLAEVILIND